MFVPFTTGRNKGPLQSTDTYDPDREAGNYVPTVLPERYDAFAFVEGTGAVHPLGIEPDGMAEPETCPWGV